MALSDIDRNDLAVGLMTRTDYPSFGYMAANNATTIWESWDYSNNTFSHNHPMFGGGPAHWLVAGLGGITPGDGARGWSQLQVVPRLAPQLAWFNVSHHTVRGTVACAWRWLGQGRYQVDVVVPPNLRAHVQLRTTTNLEVIAGSKGVISQSRIDPQTQALYVGSGAFQIVATYPPHPTQHLQHS